MPARPPSCAIPTIDGALCSDADAGVAAVVAGLLSHGLPVSLSADALCLSRLTLDRLPQLRGAAARGRHALHRARRPQWRRQDQSARGDLAARSPGRGLRGAAFEELVRHGIAGWCRVAADLSGPHGDIALVQPAAVLPREKKSRRTTAMAARSSLTALPQSSAGALGLHMRVVWLTPAMDRLFAGPAADRRRFLDRLVSAFDPEHGSASRYVRKAHARAQPAACGAAMATRSGFPASSRRWPKPPLPSRPAGWPPSRRLPGQHGRSAPLRAPFPGQSSRSHGELEALLAEHAGGAGRGSNIVECCMIRGCPTGAPDGLFMAPTGATFSSSTAPNRRGRGHARRASRKRC